jgi:hypothetical protein
VVGAPLVQDAPVVVGDNPTVGSLASRVPALVSLSVKRRSIGSLLRLWRRTPRDAPGSGLPPRPRGSGSPAYRRLRVHLLARWAGRMTALPGSELLLWQRSTDVQVDADLSRCTAGRVPDAESVEGKDSW